MPDDVLTAEMLDRMIVEIKDLPLKPLRVDSGTIMVMVGRTCQGGFREWFRATQIRRRLARRGRLHRARLERWYRNVHV